MLRYDNKDFRNDTYIYFKIVSLDIESNDLKKSSLYQMTSAQQRSSSNKSGLCRINVETTQILETTAIEHSIPIDDLGKKI